MSEPTDPRAWLEAVRRLDPDLLDAMGVKTVKHPKLGPVAGFPYRRAGETYAWKFRSINKRFASTTGVSRGLYNADDLKRLEAQPIVITEGEIDALSVMQAGYERVVSVPDGWGQGETSRAALVAEEPMLRRSPFVIVAGDTDEAGASLPRALAGLLDGHDVREARWPQGCKDPSDVLMRHGEGALASCLLNARRIDPPGGLVTGFDDLPPMSEQRILRIGMEPFDSVCAFELGALSVWTGIPGSGKSTFLTWAADRVTRHEEVRCGILAFETHPYTIRDHLSLLRTGCTWNGLTSEHQRAAVADFDRRFRLVHKRWDDGTVHRVEWLGDMVRTLAARDGCKLIIVDPWNELEHLPAPGETLTNYINWALQRLRQWAEELEVHIALVAHPKKMADPRYAPSGYDIADAAAFFNKPSLGCTVHQAKDEDGETYVELHAWKVREVRRYGFEKTKRNLAFDKTRQSYSGLIRGDAPEGRRMDGTTVRRGDA